MKELKLFAEINGTIDMVAIGEYIVKSKKPCEIIVREVKSIRNTHQNALYWFVMEECARQGKSVDGQYDAYTKETWHLVCSKAFLTRFDEASGETYVESTTKLTVKDFSAYINDCIDLVLLDRLQGSFTKDKLFLDAMGVK